MTTLVSPGVSVTITNESYYIPAASPTVPLIFLATRADKMQANGITPAPGALENGVIRTITSLNQSVSTYGVPYFRTDNTGAPLHGDARNEYGLFAMNQALTMLNAVYCVRAAVDLADKSGTAFSASSPSFVGTGTGTISAPLLNQATAANQVWTIVTNATAAAIVALGNPQTLGSGYTPGTYTGQALTGGTGSVATATIIVDGTGAVSSVTPVAGGTGYTLDDTLSASIPGTGVATLGAFTNAGSGLTNGTYTNVPLISLVGTGVLATVVVSGGIVTSVTITFRGINYTVGESLSASIASIGGAGTTFAVPVLTIGGAGFTTTATIVAATSFAVSGSVAGVQGTAYPGVFYQNSQASFTINEGAVPFRGGDAWTFNVTSTSVPSILGVNDAAKRVTIVDALIAQIAGNTDVRSEIYEYNLILCPGYFETASSMLDLNIAINSEAFVIADCPFQTNPEDTATWSLTVARQSSTNIAYYYPNALASNLDGTTVFCAASGVALKTYAYSDSVSEVWYPPAGFRRGVVTGLTDIGYVTGTLGTATTFVSTPLNQGQRDILYQYGADINPIPFFPGQGIVVFGQKTSVGNLASALDRVNVVRMMIMIKRDIRKASLSYLFELNDRITRDSIKSMIDSYLNDILLRRGLYDYIVICDTYNNTPTRVDQNQLWVDIAVQPAKSVEFIYIPINIVSTGASLG